MPIWMLLLTVCIGGAVGGVVNALITDNGFPLPRTEAVDQVRIVRPGIIGNVIISAVAAGISWGLYGLFGNAPLIGAVVAAGAAAEPYSLSLSGFVGAVLVGVARAQWLTNEVDKSLLKAAASKAAGAQGTADAARRMAMASPAQAIDVAKGL